MSARPTENPASMGRRIAARVLDSLVAGALVLGLQAAAVAAALGSGGAELVVVLLVLLLVWTALGVWTIFARAALPGQWFLGLHHVDAATRQRAGGRTFLKYLLQGCTFGLAAIITPLTIQAPNRSWFDRMAGVLLIDSRGPGPVVATPSAITAPPPGWRSDESQLTQTGHAPMAHDQTVASTGTRAMINAVPFDQGSPAVTPAPPAVERPAAVVVPPGGAVAAPSVVAPVPVAPRPVPVVTLDSGETHELTGTLIVGRNPRQSSGLGHAELVVVTDQSVSANHVALGMGVGGPWVMDLRSTNGSWVQQDASPSTRLDPMTKVSLSPGALVKIGQRTFTVSAR